MSVTKKIYVIAWFFMCVFTRPAIADEPLRTKATSATVSSTHASSRLSLADLKSMIAEGKRHPEIATLMVDMQIDFCEGGALPVKGADPTWQAFMVSQVEALRKIAGVTVLTGDNHPKGHVSFADAGKGEVPYATVVNVNYPGVGSYEQIKWPVHCVEGTKGARLVLPQQRNDLFWPKGRDCGAECYSAVKDELGRDTGFVDKLRALGVTTVIAGGLAADYCVNATIMDLAKAGIHVVILTDWTHWVNPAVRTSNIKAWQAAGIIVTNSQELGLS